MPETKTFQVTQTRRVQVCASSPEDAVRIAKEAFGEDPHERAQADGVWGYTQSPVRTFEVNVMETR